MIPPNLEPRLRIALYSHDTQGLGHIRRNLAIAGALASGPNPAAILLVSGARIASSMKMPPGVDCLTLPAVGKGSDGSYCSRSLPLPLDNLMRLRAETIRSALEQFEPHVLIVDKVADGLLGELRPTLHALRHKTRCVLGLRDILDEPAVAEREWRSADIQAVVREYYDAIWVYGDPTVYDSVAEYPFVREFADLVSFTGYLHHPVASTAVAGPYSAQRNRPLALCTVGGGQDGYQLAASFARANLPGRSEGLIVTGPYMPDESRSMLEEEVADHPHLNVVEYIQDPQALLHRAKWVVAMGGYNTTCEILAHGKRALIVPRVRPRTEQLIRAQRLSRLGLIDLMHPDALSATGLTDWMARAYGRQTSGDQAKVDLGGFGRLPFFLSALLAGEPTTYAKPINIRPRSECLTQ